MVLETLLQEQLQTEQTIKFLGNEPFFAEFRKNGLPFSLPNQGDFRHVWCGKIEISQDSGNFRAQKAIFS